MNNPLLTVVIPAYNREFYIEKTLTSIFNQTFQDFFLFILNDGSTDKTEEVIQPYLSDKRVKYFPFQENRGVGETLKFAVTQIETPYFIVVDSDDWLEEHALELLLSEIQKHDDVSMVYGNSQLWLDKGNEEFEKRGEMIHPSFDNKYDFVIYNSMPSPRMFRTELVESVNSFETDDPNGGRFGEDRYLLYKLISISKFRCVNDFVYNIRIHEDNTIKKENRVFFNETKRYVLSKLLKEWGDEYAPVYEINDSGWLNISKLIKK